MPLTEKAERICALLQSDFVLSDREIARRTGSSHTSVGTYRQHLESTGQIPPRPAVPAEARQVANGNLVRTVPGQSSATLTHGTRSPLKLAPLRLEGEAWVSTRWPFLDDTRVKLIGDLAARIELARRFTDTKGILRHKGHGIVYPIVEQLDRWERRLSDEIKSLDAEARELAKVDSTTALNAHLAEIAAGRGEDS